MSGREIRPLDFRAVDDLAFACERHRLNVDDLSFSFAGEHLGPLLELYQLSASGTCPPTLHGQWLDASSFAGLDEAIVSESPHWSARGVKPLGLLKTSSLASERHWTAFAIDAKRAGTDMGLSDDWAAQMVAAMGEFRSNIVEHSGSQATGFVAFHGRPGILEFVAADRGVGILSTLRTAREFEQLDDHAEALKLALTDGASRFGADQARGHGFRPLFTGLSNRRATLRFRTGDAALVIDGTTPLLSRAQSGRKPWIQGFFISVSCQVPPHQT